MPIIANSIDDQVADFLGGYYADLSAYIMHAYEWGEKGGPLENFEGPEKWTLDLCDEISNHIAKHGFNGKDPVDPIYVGVASGNGAAKSAFAGMFNNFIQTTRPQSVVTVSANTGAQLRTKTWPQITKWTQLSLSASWFDIQSERISHKQFPLTWATHAHTWNIANTQASAGQHAREGSSVFLIDEASHVPEAILEQMDGGLTDGEPFMILLGNCTNRASRLFRAVFGNLKKFYISRSIDTRTCKYTNKALIKQWGEQRGEDSDWFKSHVKGEAPAADDMQFIDTPRVQAARVRPVPETDGSEPLVLGIDFARGGSADNRLSWRRGRDMRSIPSRRIPGDKTRDTTLMVTLLCNEIDEKKPDAVFGDAGGLGGPIMDQLRKLRKNIPIVDVMFGGGSPDDRNGNMRAYMYSKHREWLAYGCIEDNEELEVQLTGPHSYDNVSGKLMIESKEDMEERGLASPDWSDSEILTHAHQVKPKMTQDEMKPKKRPIQRTIGKTPGRGWMGR